MAALRRSSVAVDQACDDAPALLWLSISTCRSPAGPNRSWVPISHGHLKCSSSKTQWSIRVQVPARSQIVVDSGPATCLDDILTSRAIAILSVSRVHMKMPSYELLM